MSVLHLIIKRMGKTTKYAVAIAWTLFILIASGMSKGMVQELNLNDLFQFDKIGHCLAYMAYVIFWSLALSVSYDKKKALLIAFVSSVILGFTMEIFQKYIFDGRAFDYLDLIANISGSVLGTILFNKLIKTQNYEFRI